jgi:hypothetical protein
MVSRHERTLEERESKNLRFMERKEPEMSGRKGSGNRRKCRDCGASNELSAAFCGQCGKALKGREKDKQGSGRWEPSYGVIIAIVGLIFATGFVFKMVTSRPSKTYDEAAVSQPFTKRGGPIESQVQMVASNFRCACGGCGELPLVECDCDMPRGASEEKAFIREKLREGYPVDQVIQWVEEEYGLRITG